MCDSEETNSQHDLLDPDASQTEILMASQTKMQCSSSSISSPIQQLPLDILCEIFLYCMPLFPTIQSASANIVLLSCVSPTWRMAVHASPRLWSRLLVTVQNPDDLDSQRVTEWFERARSVPLSFFLNIDFQAIHTDIPRIRTFLVDLSSVMLRVLHFAFHAKLNSRLLSSFTDLDWKLPRLRKLDLFSHARLDRKLPVAFSVPVFQTAPNLVKVAIQNTIVSYPNIQHILPWSQLTKLSTDRISITRWIEIMNMCPMIRTCGVIFKQNDAVDPPSMNSPKDTHHSLQHLDIDIMGGRMSFLEPLSFHNFIALQTLRVCYKPEPLLDFPHPQDISSLANLREFSLNATAMKISEGQFAHLSDILGEMVNLEILELQQPTRDSIAVYEALSFKQPKKAILPRLSTFGLWLAYLHQLPKEDEEIRPLFDMLASRCKADTIPEGYDSVRYFELGAATLDTYEQIRPVFDPWIVGLPPQLKVNIELSRSAHFNQPPGWTHPISE